MDMKNVKLDWTPILEGQIKYLESAYPDLPIRKSFGPIIEMLNANKIRSRVILSGINVSAYAFITPSAQHTDRLYATVGFTDAIFVNEDRAAKLMTWLEDYAKKQDKYIMLNEIFNAEDKSDELLLKRKYGKIVRHRLLIDLNDYKDTKAPLTEDFKQVPVNNVNAGNYSDAEFAAFQDSEDEILFNAGNRDERVEFSKGLLEGSLGEIIEDASKILMDDDHVVSAILTSDYRSINDVKTALISDLFVDKPHRGRGIAKHLILFTLNSLKLKSYDECALWVSTENPAKKIYEKIGFKDTGTTEIFYYLKP